jgi:hypothetical protein
MYTRAGEGGLPHGSPSNVPSGDQQDYARVLAVRSQAETELHGLDQETGNSSTSHLTV